MNKELEVLKSHISKDKPFYLLRNIISSKLKVSSLANILLLAYDIGIVADLLINQTMTYERKESLSSYLHKEYFIDKAVAEETIEQWMFLLDIEGNETLHSKENLASEFLSGEVESTHSKIILVGHRDIELEEDAVELESKVLSKIFLSGLKSGELSKVKEAVEQGFSIDFKDKGNRDALIIWITKKGYLDILSYLINKGIDIWNPFENGRTILMYVVKTEHLDMFEYLLSLGLDINTNDDSGKTVLMYAAERGYLPMIKKVVNAGASVNIGTDGFTKINKKKYSIGKTALMYSIASKNESVINYLLENGADILATKNGARKSKKHGVVQKGKNIVMYAVENGDVSIMSFLVDKGAELLNVKDEFGNTPLIYAVIKKDIKMIKFLIANGVSLNKLNKSNLNPLIYAIKLHELDIVKLLIAEGALLDGDIYVVDDFEIRKPIHYAIKEGDEDIIKHLLSQNADVNAQDEQGRSPLMYSIQKNNLKAIKQLITLKVNIELCDFKGKNALWYAGKENNNKMISILENYIKKDYR